MQKLLDDLHINDTNDWENISNFKSKRKESIQETLTTFMKPIQFQENFDLNENDGFRTVESMNRIQKLRQLRQKPLPTQTQQVQPQTQVISSYQNTNAKAAKNKKAMAPKTQIKIKFSNYGAVKSEWNELNTFNYGSFQKVQVEHTLETIIEPGVIPQFNSHLLQVKPKKPFSLKNINHNVFNPQTLLKNATLIKHFNDTTIPEGEFGLFMEESTLMSLVSIMKREFPFNISVIKQNNKFAFISDYSNNNVFSVTKTFNENSNKQFSEKEEDIASYCIENSIVEDKFILNAGRELESQEEEKSTAQSQSKFFKLTLKNKYHVYSSVKVDLQNTQGANLLARSLFESDKHWHNLETKLDEIVTSLLLENSSRVFEWIFAGFLANSEQLVIGLTSRANPERTENHMIQKVICKNFKELIKLYNMKMNDFFGVLANLFDNIGQIKENGNYILHKIAYKQEMKIFYTGK